MQISEWQAYDKIDPVGTWRDDYRFSFLSSLITNIAIRAWGKEGAILTEVKDFIFDWDASNIKEKEVDDIEKVKNFFLGMARNFKKKKK